MEAAPLDPPLWLDRLVTLLIPPGAREAVVGDLHEYCVTPRQYAHEALHIAPFVIASQIRRNLNFPALVVQAGLLFCGLGGVAALAALPLLLLWAAYQPLTRPSPGQALRGAVIVSFSGVMLLLLVPVIFGQGVGLAATRPGAGLALFILGMPLSPLLCGFRACLIIGNDHQGAWPGPDLSMAELAEFRRVFLRKARRRNLVEGAALALCAACWPLFTHWGSLGVALTAIYGVVAVYLLTEYSPYIEPRPDFVSLRARYGHELICQQHLRRFLWWLWLAPVLLTLQMQAATGQLTVVQCSIAAMLLCFVVTALNREGAGRLHERINALERAREQPV